MTKLAKSYKGDEIMIAIRINIRQTEIKDQYFFNVLNFFAKSEVKVSPTFNKFFSHSPRNPCSSIHLQEFI